MAEDNTPTAEEQAAKIEKLEKKIENQQKLIADLKDKLKEKTAQVAKSKQIVKDSDGESYELTASEFTFKNVKHSFASLSDNPEAVSQLAKKGVGFLKKI